MRILFAIVFFLTFCTYAGDTNLTTKVSEKRNKEGKVIRRIETVYRGETKVLMTLSHTNKDELLTADSRSYFADGELIMMEADEDKDGVFETVVIVNPTTKEIEMFIRQPNGLVTPADSRVIAATKKQFAETDNFWDYAFDDKISDAVAMKRLGETQRRIQELEKEKKSDKAE